ncbi:MAG: flagellar assembly protein A, partial [Candidatus Latescibacterota bacterium]
MTQTPEPRAPHPADSAERAAPSPLAGLVVARAAAHSHDMIAGLGLKAIDADALRQRAAGPGGAEALVAAVEALAEEALGNAGIVCGILDDAVRQAAAEFVAALLGGQERIVTRKVAEGEPPQAGEAGRIEYALNHRGQPFRELANLEPGSPRTQRTVVAAEDVLAVLHPPVAPRKGVTVRGESVEAEAGEDRHAAQPEAIAGENTRVAGSNLVATCDGLCEENAAGRLRVVPQVTVRSVDEASGRVPPTGITQANVVVEGSMRGQGVATNESLFVGAGAAGGDVEGRAAVRARRLVVAGRLVGESEGRTPPIEVDEICVVGEVTNRNVAARRILVAGDCHFAQLDAEEEAWISGSLRGGVVQCRASLRVGGDLGTPGGGSRTRICLAAGGLAEHHQRRLASALRQHRAKLKELAAVVEELDGRAEKRGRSDAYWARLLQGERVPPQGPLQIRALRQFAEYSDQKRDLGRRIKGVQATLARLAA